MFLCICLFYPSKRKLFILLSYKNCTVFIKKHIQAALNGKIKEVEGMID